MRVVGDRRRHDQDQEQTRDLLGRDGLNDCATATAKVLFRRTF